MTHGIAAVFTPTPDPRSRIQPGDITETWCSLHLDRTDHLWTGSKLICLECHPEKDPRKEGEG